MHALLRADASPDIGAGHVSRLLALGEVLVSRGERVTLMSGLKEVDWLLDRAYQVGIDIVECKPASLEQDEVEELEPDCVVVDGYSFLDSDIFALEKKGIPVAEISDSQKSRSRFASLVIHQSGICPDNRLFSSEQTIVGGLDYLLIRKSFVGAATRPQSEWEGHVRQGQPARGLVVVGGTDPTDFGSFIHRHVLSISRRESLATRLSDVVLPGKGRDLVELVTEVDFAVCAAGVTAWELMASGLPTAIVCVSSNQAPNYEFMTTSELAVGLGNEASIRQSPKEARSAIEQLLVDNLRRRDLSARCLSAIDGRGVDRSADALLSLVGADRVT